ncbi:hypothetical protein CspeluHIS016_0401530 [Cutaneotrichosporon spelunceum]|uniref:Uncharacterized protein n=1 Tax=Cutaneotrichosporon spelunceum TaxID=1672016 RepID=A0AAD3TVK6_9TREE|nr:hypothetical protein CspeluHIS016_0401530 [Cutaneotrichosporon spelunceum]
MGNCFSDPSKKDGQRLGSAPTSPTASGQQAPRPAGNSGGGKGRTVSSSGPQSAGGRPPGNDPRSAAAAAAEARAQAANNRGVSTTKAGAGKLSSKLQEERKATSPQQRQGNERMMDRGDWN